MRQVAADVGREDGPAEAADAGAFELPKKTTRQMTTRIGMVFQQFNLFPNMTVIENIIEAPIHVLGK